MQTITYKISQDIFSKEPNFKRAVLVFRNVINTETSEEVWELFKQAVTAVKQTVTPETITEQPQIAAWRSAFKSMGVNPTNDKPAIEALLRRVVNNPEGFKPINLAVDLGNVCSLKYMMPIGVHPIANDSKNIELRLATGEETYTDFSGTKTEKIPQGEIVFADGDAVLTRKWVWRQSRQSIIDVSTDNFFINLDFILPKDDREIKIIVEEVGNIFKKYFLESPGTFLLTQSNPFIPNLMSNE